MVYFFITAALVIALVAVHAWGQRPAKSARMRETARELYLRDVRADRE